MSTHWYPGNADLPVSGVTAGTYGDATHVGQFTVTAAGLVTAASNVATGGGGGGSFALIGDSVLAVDTASFDTNTILGGNIAGTYKQLVLMLKLLSTVAGTNDLALMAINNDSTAANYDSQRMSGSGGSASAGESLGTAAGIVVGTVAGATAPASAFSPVSVELPAYAATNNLKQTLSASFSYLATGSGGLQYDGRGGVWLSTAAITRLAVKPLLGANWKAGSQFTLYGLG